MKAVLKDLISGMSDLFVPPKKFPKTEEELFLADYANKNLMQRKLFLIIGFIIWTAFSYWDYHHRIHHPEFTQEILYYVLEIRAVEAVLLIYVSWVSFGERFKNERYTATLATVVIAISILCLVIMIGVMPAPLNYQYYFVGIVLVLFFQYGTMALLSRYSLVTTILSVVFLSVQDALYAPLGIYFFPAMFYLIAFASIGWAISIRFERAARDSYSQTKDLRSKNITLIDANASVWREKRKVDAALQELFNKELQKARELNEKSEATTRFVRAAYHDTMQPLASITTLALAGDRAVAEGALVKLTDTFKEIATASKEINLLFKGLRDVFMIGETLPVIDTISLNSVFEELEQVYRSLAEEKNIAFKVIKRQKDIYVLSDKGILKRVISNLLANAIKYTNSGGVLIGSVAGKATVRIDVIDTGVGIPDKFKKKIFDEFFQIDNPSHDSQMGLGLGLSIVRNFIDRLPGHRISFSTKEGKGTRFSIDCPVSEISDNYDNDMTILENGSDVDVAGAYVMLVDDDVRILSSLAKALGILNIIVVIAHDLPSVQGLLENAPDRQPDVLITDYKLANEITGLAVIDRVRQYYSWAKVPAIVFSAELSANLLGGREMVEFVRKGDEATVLIRTIQELLLVGRSANASLLEDESTPKI
jgi:signal transduction histidine kinase/CheY-like chemotaxis protein